MIMLALSAVAHAGFVDAWSVENFGHDQKLDGNGWEAGWRNDPWESWEGAAYTTTDEHISGGFNGYGTGSAADNWLIKTGVDRVTQGYTEIVFASNDDDTFGLVTNHNGDDSFYLLLYSEDSVPPPYDYVSNGRVILLKVKDGIPTPMLEIQKNINTRDWSSLGLLVSGETLSVYVNGDMLSDVWDSSPLGAGVSGLYAYDSGTEPRGDASNAAAAAIGVWWLDANDDLVADDLEDDDNNAGDGGDDGSPDGGDDGGSDDGGSDDGSDGPGGLGSGDGGTGPTLFRDDESADDIKGCSTRGAGGPAGLAWLTLLGGLVATRRRRSS